MNSDSITIRHCGHERAFPVEIYTTIREFVTSRVFLDATTESPNNLTYFVNGEPVYDDYLLVSGDILEFETACEKALLPPREVIKKLRRLVGLTFVRHGAAHDIWTTTDGRTIPFPRHARDLAPGTLKSIIKEAGLDLSIDEFISK
jgi:predicted RNA binding protein YcfA (HicA-like mRNA interferase family)